jgi:hypothetical protein
MVVDFTDSIVPAHSDGQIDRAAQRLGLIAAAGELATALRVTPWQQGEARAAASWALVRWIDRRGGTEPAEVWQAIEQVRLFIEQHGESRFDTLDDLEARPVSNRAGWRKGSGPHREWMIPPEVWKTEICNGLDATLVARTLAERCSGTASLCFDKLTRGEGISSAHKREMSMMRALIEGTSPSGQLEELAEGVAVKGELKVAGSGPV